MESLTNNLTWRVKTYQDDKFTPASVIREEDGEVFAIGDFVSNGTRMKGVIEKFELSSDLSELYVYTDWSGIGMNLDSIYKTIKLPSRFQHHDKVNVVLDDKQQLTGKITKVSFTQSKVLYDVEIEINLPNDEVTYTRVHSIDSVFVSPAE